jgi:hypothetical protein
VAGAIALVCATTFLSCILLGLLAEFVLATAFGAGNGTRPRGARA